MCATFFRKENVNLSRAAFPKINVNTLERFPIPELSENEESILEKYADEIASKVEKFVKIETTFCKFLQSQFSIEKLSRKLKKWHELESGDFIKELNKAIKKVGIEPLDDKRNFSLSSLFEEQKKEAQTLKTQIDKTNAEIDAMVYDLYGLSKDEIAIVENR